MKVVFYERYDYYEMPQPDVELTVNSMSWSAVGGPKQATITATGGELALFQLLNMLKYMVKIFDENGQIAWWGYINDATITKNGQSGGVSLDTVYNNVAVAYSFVDSGSQTVGQRKTTAWAEDEGSLGEFDYKEMLVSLSGSTDAAALAVRDSFLTEHKYPLYTPRMNSGVSNKKISVTLNCLGFWEILNWRYYANTATTTADTTQQILTMVATSGTHHFLGTDIAEASGLLTSIYRDGDSTILDEIKILLSMGGAGNRRLLATVTPERWVKVFEEPTDTEYLIDANGILKNITGNKIPPWLFGAGHWAGLDFLPSVVDVYHMTDANRMFIELMEWTPQGVRYEGKGVNTVSNLMAVQR